MSALIENLALGATIDLGSHTFTEAEIIGFARRYDPQPFHLDHAAAARSPFGRLAASGWHTAAIWMKLYVAHRRAATEAAGGRGEPVSRPGASPGFRQMTWHRPVHAGDTIRYATTLTGTRSTAMPGWGLIDHHSTGTNQDGVLVFAFDGMVLLERPNPDQPRP